MGLFVTAGRLTAEIEVDECGLSASKLEAVLSSWPAGRKRPRII
jgi:hypothetical protein